MRSKATMLVIMVVTLVFLAAVPGMAQTTDAPQPTNEGQAFSSQGKFVRVTGVIKKQGITGYQYGSHVIVDQRTKRLYALRGKRGINLNRYVGKRVKLVGKRVRGYPINLGPPLLKVVKIRSAYPIRPL